jgi:CRISPR-associated protein Csm5
MLDVKKILLRTVSPIHIEGREIEYGWGMVKLSPADPYAYIIDQDKLASVLGGKGWVKEYVECFSTPDSFKGQRLREFLENKLNKDENKLRDILLRISGGKTISRRSNYFIRNGFDKVIIPGSSIKGALRTAVAYKVLKDKKQNQPAAFNNEVATVVARKLNQYQSIKDRRERADFKKSFFKELTEEIFGDEPHCDLFRSIRVSDTIAIDREPREETIKVVCINSANTAYFAKRPSGAEIILQDYECLPEQTRATFSITLDRSIMKQWAQDLKKALPFTTIEELLQIATEFAQDQWAFESRFLSAASSGINIVLLRRFYQGSRLVSLRLGWGTGMLGTTIDLLLDNGLRQGIRNIMTPRGVDPAPKSRRTIIRDGSPSLPLGWVSLESVSAPYAPKST